MECSIRPGRGVHCWLCALLHNNATYEREGVAPCGLHTDGAHGRAGKHYSTQANGSAWCGWRTGMLLLASGGAGDLGKDLSKNAQENALLQLLPARCSRALTGAGTSRRQALDEGGLRRRASDLGQ